MGWDGSCLTDTDRRSRFQSTHPVWDGTFPISAVSKRLTFQSTHPVWDGTAMPRRAVALLSNFNPPIPCGMGRCSSTRSLLPQIFQSTHPVWDGTSCMSSTCQLIRDFNPPIPCGMGRDDGLQHCRMLLISIHPSRVGWDKKCTRNLDQSTYFNPPIPCGMGRPQPLPLRARKKFQSTHPVWDGTWLCC